MKDDKGERLVNAPAPKPIADCPNTECKESVPQCVPFMAVNNEKKYLVRCYDCGYGGPWADTRDEAIRLHNLIARPQQSAEPVAWYDLPMANIELADAIVQEWQKRVESGAPAMPWGIGELVELISKLRPAAFPGPSELVEEMEKLANEWERLATSHINAGSDNLLMAAHDLRALITRHRGKS